MRQLTQLAALAVIALVACAAEAKTLIQVKVDLSRQPVIRNNIGETSPSSSADQRLASLLAQRLPEYFGRTAADKSSIYDFTASTGAAASQHDDVTLELTFISDSCFWPYEEAKLEVKVHVNQQVVPLRGAPTVLRTGDAPNWSSAEWVMDDLKQIDQEKLSDLYRVIPIHVPVSYQIKQVPMLVTNESLKAFGFLPFLVPQAVFVVGDSFGNQRLFVAPCDDQQHVGGPIVRSPRVPSDCLTPPNLGPAPTWRRWPRLFLRSVK